MNVLCCFYFFRSEIWCRALLFVSIYFPLLFSHGKTIMHCQVSRRTLWDVAVLQFPECKLMFHLLRISIYSFQKNPKKYLVWQKHVPLWKKSVTKMEQDSPEMIIRRGRTTFYFSMFVSAKNNEFQNEARKKAILNSMWPFNRGIRQSLFGTGHECGRSPLI